MKETRDRSDPGEAEQITPMIFFLTVIAYEGCADTVPRMTARNDRLSRMPFAWRVGASE